MNKFKKTSSRRIINPHILNIKRLSLVHYLNTNQPENTCAFKIKQYSQSTINISIDIFVVEIFSKKTTRKQF